MLEMVFSLPGMNFAESMTVSPFIIFICLWLFMAIRVSALMGSPWLPVVRITAFFAGISSSSLMSAIRESLALRYPRFLAILAFPTMLLPLSMTTLPSFSETSKTCWIRWMLDENAATIILPGHFANISSKACPITLSERV